MTLVEKTESICVPVLLHIDASMFHLYIRLFSQHSRFFSRFVHMASNSNHITSSTLSASEKEMIERVHSHFPNNQPTKFNFFYATASPFSNFHPCSFEENGIQFDCSERYMMYHKASKSSNVRFWLTRLKRFLLSKSCSTTKKQLKKSWKRKHLPIAKPTDEEWRISIVIFGWSIEHVSSRMRFTWK